MDEGPDEYIGQVVEVMYNEKIKAKGNLTYSLFLPRFKRFRKDKNEADSLTKIK